MEIYLKTSASAVKDLSQVTQITRRKFWQFPLMRT